MNAILEIACITLFLISAPALVIARFVWPRRFQWWVVVVSAAGLAWVLLPLGEHFRERQESECEVRVIDESERSRTIGGCVLADGRATYNLELGWLKGLIYLVPWLVAYWTVQRIRRNRNA